MENLGNTTIVTDAALITEHTLDTMLLYAHAVIVHEFEHNQCGSETTMETPFDVWLNEAYTVDVERQFMADHFDPAFIRLHQVDSIRSPLLGPLAIEDGGHYGRIVREGFNEPDELIDGVTYVKAAEVIRMLRLIIGPDAFQKGKSLYFDRYLGGNADTDQFFACFEEVSGLSLTEFKREWLYRIGYPKVSATTEYNGKAGEYRIHLSQEVEEGENPFCLPLKVALVDGEGRDMEGTERVFTLSEGKGEIVFENITEPPAIASMNRDYSFYGTFKHTNVDAEALARQTRFDPNIYNRVDAMRHLTDTVRISLLNDPNAPICEEWLNLYGEILSDRTLPAAIKAYLLRIDEQPIDRQYSAWYRELVVARERLMSAVNGRYRDELVREFNAIGGAIPSHGGTPDTSISEGIERRMLKNILLHLIAIDDTPESHRLIIDTWQTAATATERVAALTALNRSSAPSRRTLLEGVYRDWHNHLSGYANYLRVVASGAGEDIFKMIKAEESRSSFDITHPTWSRALYLGMATNTKMIWTDRGIEWVADTVIRLAPINGTTAGRLLNTFQHLRLLKPPLREKVHIALERIVESVTEDVSLSIHGQGMAYLGK
jgi:aminopeptidase N